MEPVNLLAVDRYWFLLKRHPSAHEPAAKIADLCRRAAVLLLDQDDHARATRVLDKATTLAPQHPDLPQLRVRLDRLKITQQPTEPPPPPEAVPAETGVVSITNSLSWAKVWPPRARMNITAQSQRPNTRSKVSTSTELG